MSKLVSKYGEEMFELEGIARKNLDVAGFTNSFLETKTTADISIDANANVADMSILSWNFEFPKPLAKLNALYHLWSDACAVHGVKRANKMVEAEIAGAIRIHDLHGWLMPYSYASNTYIELKNIENKDLYISLGELFIKYESKKQILPDREIIDLHNENIFVKDGNGNYTKITQCLKHKRDCEMLEFVIKNTNYKKTLKNFNYGYTQGLVVTANHPMIMKDGSEREASLIKIGDHLKGEASSNYQDMVVVDIIEVNGPEYEYVYDISTESHTFKVGYLTVHNCWATSLAPIVNEGMPWIKNIRVKPVKHFLTLISNSVKYIYNLSTQCVGAIAVPDFLAYAEYFIRKDYGEEWYNNTVHVNTVRQLFQNWIYSVNDKARGNQSLVYNEKIIVDGVAIEIGKFVESLLTNNSDEAPVLDIHYTFTLNRTTGRLEANRIKGVIRHKTANKIVEYVLSNGATIKATDNHSFFTRDGLTIKEIQRNSNPTNLLIPFNFAKEETELSELQVLQTVGKKDAKNILLTEKWMYLLGQYLGDGCWDGSSLHIATCDDIANNILIDMFPEFTYHIKSDNSIRLNVGRNITDAIKAIFNTGSHNKVLPRTWVNKKNILHLIGGYIDSDGFAPTDGYKGFVIVSTNKELLESTQFILAGYGIFSSIKEKYHKGFNNKMFTTYRLTISAVGSRLLNNYTHLKKVRVPEEITNIDTTKLYVDYDGILKTLNIDKHLLKGSLKDRSIQHDHCGYEDIKLLINILNNNNLQEQAKEVEKFLYAMPIKIIEIRECEQEEFVYDISVENNENFLTASNIYAHNSPFVNVSIFDRYWREAMFGKHTNPDFSPCNLENLKRVQRLFIDVLIEEQTDNPFTFPVLTGCQLKSAETGEIMDQDWLDWISGITVKNKLINFYTSETCDSLSSCLSGKEFIHVINNETGNTEVMTVKAFVNKFTKNEDDLIDTELDTKYSVVTYNYDTKTWEKEKIVGVLKKLSSKIQMVKITVDGKSIEVTPDHEFTVHKLDTDTIEQVQAKDIYANPNNFEIAVEE